MKKYIFGFIFALLLCRTWCEVPAYTNIETLMRSNIINFPKSAQAHCNLGACYFTRGDMKNAEEEYKRAIQLDPDFALAYYNLGVIYLDKDKEVAKMLINKAYDLLPSDSLISDGWKKNVEGQPVTMDIQAYIPQKETGGWFMKFIAWSDDDKAVKLFKAQVDNFIKVSAMIFAGFIFFILAIWIIGYWDVKKQ